MDPAEPKAEPKAEPTMTSRYVLVKKGSLEPATWHHQDDMEDPITADNVIDLIERAADWADYGSDNFLRALVDPTSEFYEYTIVREDVIVSQLSPEEQKELAELVAAACEDEDE